MTHCSYAKYVSDFRTNLISKLRGEYALVRAEVEEMIQRYTTEYLNAERLKDFLAQRDQMIGEKNKEILELQTEIDRLRFAKRDTSNTVVPLFVKFRSGGISPGELIDQLSNVLSAYGWNVKK